MHTGDQAELETEILAEIDADFDDSDDDSEEAVEMHVNAKISDADVVRMRKMRAKSVAVNDPISWERLGKLFGDLHEKTCYRICTGMSRPKAGGPLEPIIPDTAGHETVRCRGCGQRHLKAEICTLCQCRWAGWLVKVFSIPRLVNASQF